MTSNITTGICIHYCAELQDNISYALNVVLEAGHEPVVTSAGVDGQYNQYGESNVSECSSPCSGNVYQTCGTGLCMIVSYILHFNSI